MSKTNVGSRKLKNEGLAIKINRSTTSLCWCATGDTIGVYVRQFSRNVGSRKLKNNEGLLSDFNQHRSTPSFLCAGGLRGVCDNFQEIGSEKFASQFSRFPDTQNDRQENIVHTFTMFMFCYGLWFHQEWKRFANTETTKIFISKYISNLFPTFLGKILNLFNFCLLLFCIEKKNIQYFWSTKYICCLF